MASANIVFDNIGSSIRKPGKYAEFNFKLAVRTLPGNLQKVVIAGQKTAAGALPALTPLDIFSDDEAAIYFGRGSVGHLMVRAALQTNPYLALTIIALDDAGAGVYATGTDTIAGTATGVGVLTLNVGDQSAQVAIASGDTAAAVAAALNAQIAKQPNLPVTSAVVGGVVTLTAKNKGTLGNGIKLSTTITAAGLTSTVVAMASGATDPVLANALAVVFAAGHNIIASAYNDATNLTALRTHLDNVSGPLEKRGCIATYGHVGTLGASTTLASGVNSGRIYGLLVPNAYEASYEASARFAALIASEEDPARPLNGLPLTGMIAPPLANRLSRTEQENALYNGVTPTEVGPGGKVQIVRAISTYTLDAQGIPDISQLDITTIRTLDYVRKAIIERLSLRFPREKKSLRTKRKVQDEVMDVLYKLEELEIIEAVTENKDGVIVEDDLQDPNRLNIRIPADVVNGLHVIAARIDLLL